MEVPARVVVSVLGAHPDEVVFIGAPGYRGIKSGFHSVKLRNVLRAVAERLGIEQHKDRCFAARATVVSISGKVDNNCIFPLILHIVGEFPRIDVLADA